MIKLGDQWIEVIDGKMHMYKAVEGPCERCDISHTCNLSADCHMERGLIAKDLGILNEEGCLPSAWDKALYPQVYRTTETIWYAHAESYGIFMEAKGKTKQEAICAWNRRA